MVPPIYPPLASKTRISGTVVLEATLTAEGRVEEIKVISGHPLLVDAAIKCLKQWEYEPSYLNGIPIPVILTAKVHFYQAAPIS
jgi:periplasmic protein TonB